MVRPQALFTTLTSHGLTCPPPICLGLKYEPDNCVPEGRPGHPAAGRDPAGGRRRP